MQVVPSDMGKRPFHCGSQYEDWSGKNCESCALGAKEPDFEMKCDIEQALLEACFRDGCVEEPIYERMGAEENKGHYIWQCPEKQMENDKEEKAYHDRLKQMDEGWRRDKEDLDPIPPMKFTKENTDTY